MQRHRSFDAFAEKSSTSLLAPHIDAKTVPVIRPVELSDAPALREIYRPYVEQTVVSFEITVPTLDEYSKRIAAYREKWAWLVAEVNGGVVGYAYGSAHRPREAYSYSVETSAYVMQEYHRQGIARVLYTQLFDALEQRGFGNAYAGITLPNDASVAFHRSLGFKDIGVFPRVGWKFGRWHDVAWLHRSIQASVPVAPS